MLSMNFEMLDKCNAEYLKYVPTNFVFVWRYVSISATTSHSLGLTYIAVDYHL